MSRNPYLAATRPTSSFTRSSRTSKRNDASSSSSSSKAPFLSRSRSSATITGANSLSSQLGSFNSVSAYTPTTTNTWQRPSTRTNPVSSSSASSSSAYNKSSGGDSYSSSSPSYQYNHNQERFSYEPTSRLSLNRSSSSQQINFVGDSDEAAVNASDRVVRENKPLEDSDLRNYQQSKLLQQQQQSPTARSSLQSLDYGSETRKSNISLDSDAHTELSYDESESIKSGSAPRHLKQGQLFKSRSLDVSRQAPPADSSLSNTASMSVDRLLLRSESMTDRELRRAYKELVMENERLKKQLKGVDDNDKQKQQDWIRKERQLQRKISELEEENRQLDQWKQEIQRLKDENSSLIRVVSKLSKKN